MAAGTRRFSFRNLKLSASTGVAAGLVRIGTLAAPVSAWVDAVECWAFAAAVVVAVMRIT